MDIEELQYKFGKAVFVRGRRLKHAWEDAQAAWALYRCRDVFPEDIYERVALIIEAAEGAFRGLPGNKQNDLERAMDFARSEMPDQGYFACARAMILCCDDVIEKLKKNLPPSTPRDPQIQRFQQSVSEVCRLLNKEGDEIKDFIDRFVPFPATGETRGYSETYFARKVRRIVEKQQGPQPPGRT